MAKRDEFKALMEMNKKAMPNITNEAREDYLNLARTYYELTTPEAEELLKEIGMTVGPSVNYFEVLKLTIETLEDQSESKIKEIVHAAFLTAFKRALAMAHNPHLTEREKEEMKNNVNRAKEILSDPVKRKMHIRELTPEPEALFKFPNGDEAISIPQLALLMAKNARDAVEALYQGNLEQSLRRFGETHFANAARAVVSQFPRNRQIGFLAISAILRGKVKFRQGNEASTPQQLARLIDQNWEQSKTLLYNGFIALWLEYTKQTQLATTAKAITNRNRSEQDIGLEELVQKLDPQIGKPKLEVSPSRIDFGSIDTESQKTIDIQITNRGRGFLYGTAQLATDMPGLQISDTEIRDEGVISVKLDTSRLAPNKTYQTILVLNTNGDVVRVPISCDVIQKTMQVVPDFKVKNRVERTINYFEVLGLSVDDIQGKDEGTIKSIVNGAHRKLYTRTVGAYANVPRPDGRTPGQWQVILNHARDTLLDSQKRRVYITERTQQPEVTEIEEAPDVNIKDEDGRTPLHHAAEKNDYVIAQVLLKYGANVNAKDKEGDTPLHTAVYYDASEVAEILLKYGADINARDKTGRTPLYWTIPTDSSEVAEILLKYGADINADIGLIDSAAEQNASEVAELLLKYGANVNETNYDGNTLLHMAAKSGLLNASEVAEVLLKYGADVNAENKRGRTPLGEAVNEESLTAAGTLPKIIEVLLKYGADVNAEIDLLHMAAKRNAFKIAEILLKHDANVNAKDKYGYTALHKAAADCGFETAEMLLNNGADANAKTNKGSTPLHIAARENSSEIAEVLLRNGAKVNAKNNDGQTPLHIAKNKTANETEAVLRQHGGRKGILW